MNTKMRNYALYSLLLLLAACHSWVEQLSIISSDGQFHGQPGYMRGYVPRGPGFADALNTHLLPPLESGRLRLDGTDLVCMPTQQAANYTTGYPPLSAQPGDYLAIRYLENGHVTLPQNQVGKPGSAGLVTVYMTQEPRIDEKLLDVLAWNVEGTGGDQRGMLVTTQNFDNGRCYQMNSSPMQLSRAQAFPNKPPDTAPGTADQEVWCETDVQVPPTAEGVLTVYWIWNWATLPNRDPSLPEGKAETYTSCVDIVVGSSESTLNLEHRDLLT